jgi:hypothetical protein
MRLKKIVSGGQTGVDRAALDAALAVNFPCGGWVPGDRIVVRICFPGRGESVHGRCGKNFLFLTPRKTNLDPQVGVHGKRCARDSLVGGAMAMPMRRWASALSRHCGREEGFGVRPDKCRFARSAIIPYT